MTSSFGLDLNIEATDELTAYTLVPVIYEEKRAKMRGYVYIWKYISNDFLGLSEKWTKYVQERMYLQDSNSLCGVTYCSTSGNQTKRNKSLL